jgi:hypothetical protein
VYRCVGAAPRPAMAFDCRHPAISRVQIWTAPMLATKFARPSPETGTRRSTRPGKLDHE